MPNLDNPVSNLSDSELKVLLTHWQQFINKIQAEILDTQDRMVELIDKKSELQGQASEEVINEIQTEIDEYQEQIKSLYSSRKSKIDTLVTIITAIDSNFIKENQELTVGLMQIISDTSPEKRINVFDKLLEVSVENSGDDERLIYATCQVMDDIRKLYPNIGSGKDASTLVDIYCKYGKRLNELAKKVEKGNSPKTKEAFKKAYEAFLNDVMKYPDELCEKVKPADIVKDFGLSTFLEGLSQLEQEGKSIEKYLTNPLEITVSDYKKLLETKNIPKGLKICVVCKNASELTVQDMEQIQGRFKCEIRFEDINLETYQKAPYTLEQYCMCREKIDELIGSIEFPESDDIDKEKKIFGQVVRRLANYIKYNNDHTDTAYNIKAAIKRIENMSLEGKKNNQKSLETLKEALRGLDYTTPRNMVGGLLHGQSVCAGYAEILRNVLACCGIECRYVSGYPIDKERYGHAWNQVKLDGKWYNSDLTEARDCIVDPRIDKSLLRNLLATDDEFKALGHDRFCRNRGQEEVCDTEIELSKIIGLVGITGVPYNQVLADAANGLTYSGVMDTAAKFQRGMGGKDGIQVTGTR